MQAQERGEFPREKCLPAQPWIDAWKKLRPEILDITGGEPFLQPELVRIIQELAANGSRMAMTSNLSFPILEFVQKVTPDQMFSITASFHPSQNGTAKKPMNPDIFLGRVLLLQEFGFRVTVNIVAYPEQIWLLPKHVKFFEDHNVRWHVDPYGPISYYPWRYTEKERELLSKFVGDDRKQQPDIGPVSCSGGQTHLSVQPDGSAWRCILETQQGLNPLGNILQEDFELPRGDWLRCDQQKNCPGCDRDKVQVVPIT